MKIELIGSPKVAMSNPNSLHGYFAWPTVTKLQDGRIALVASGFRLGHICPFGKTVISYSSDNGETFTPPTPVIDTPLDDRDGGVCPFGENGIVVTSFNNTVKFQRETADSLNNPTRRAYHHAYLDIVTPEDEAKYLGSTFRTSTDGGVTWGDVKVAPVSSPHGPTVLKNGKILWVGREFYPTDPNPKDDFVKAYYIDPVSGEFEYVGTVTQVIRDGNHVRSFEPNTYEREDGRLICHLRVPSIPEPRSHTTYQSVSDDGGKTWSTPIPLLENGYANGTPAHIIRHSSGALVSTYSFRKPPFGIKAMISTDGGDSWDTSDYRIYTNAVSSDLGYPSTVELDDGTCLTAFYARPDENTPCQILIQRWKLVN